MGGKHSFTGRSVSGQCHRGLFCLLFLAIVASLSTESQASSPAASRLSRPKRVPTKETATIPTSFGDTGEMTEVTGSRSENESVSTSPTFVTPATDVVKKTVEATEPEVPKESVSTSSTDESGDVAVANSTNHQASTSFISTEEDDYR